MTKLTSATEPANYPHATALRALSCAPFLPLAGGPPSFAVLIIEASRVLREFLNEALHSQFPWLTVATAARVEDALGQIGTIRPDLIFLDVHLAEWNGFELARRIRSIAVDANIVAFTSFDFPEYREEALRSGADYFLVKGAATVSDIYSLVGSIVASRVPH